MPSKLKLIGLLFILTMLVIIMNYESQHLLVHESTWQQYEMSEEAEWSSEKLLQAKRYYKRLNSTSAMLIYDGKVVAAWGDVTKNTNVHSIRKSFFNALYGIFVEEGFIDLEESVGDLDILENSTISN